MTLVNGRLHSITEPAYVFSDNDKVIEEWYYEGKLHRDSGPARLIIHKGLVEKEYYNHGVPLKFERNNIICEFKDGNLAKSIDREGTTCFYNQGVMERYESKNKVKYYKYGKLHRDNKPAKFGSNGKQWFYNNGRLYNRIIRLPENNKVS